MGLVIASGGTDITVWLLFGSVVRTLSCLVFVFESCLDSEKFLSFLCRLVIYHYRLEKLTGGISGSLSITRLTDMPFSLMFTKLLREREHNLTNDNSYASHLYV